VENLQDVMRLWDEFKVNNPIHTTDQFFGRKVAFPTGYGFRGLKSVEHKLIPSAFRNDNYILPSRGRTYEQSIYYGFRLFVNEPPINHHSTFDWLTLMQHYDSPTRLLDWSESILKSLFFSVENPPSDKDLNEPNPDNQTKKKLEPGLIWVLNAYKLNRLTSLFGTEAGVGVPESLNTMIRAEMTTANDLHTLFRRRSILDINAFDLPHNDSLQNIFDRVLSGKPPLEDYPNLTHKEFIHRLHSPFATQSYRLNERIKLQNGFFTVFGGKACNLDEKQDRKPKWPLSEYMSLEDLNNLQDDKDKFLIKFCVITAKGKKNIYNELFELGINKATVYADTPNISKYVIELANRFEQPYTPESKK
jgi:hypothetical protein